MAEFLYSTLYTDANLQEYYKLEDLTGKNGNTLTNNNSVTFSAGKFNNGADLGSSDGNKALTVASAFSIDGGACGLSCWVKLNTEIASGTYRFLNVGNTTSDTEYYIDYQYNAGTRRLAWGRGKVGVANEETYYTVTLGTSNFYHLVLAYDATNLRGYVDNVLQSGPTAASGSGSAGNTGFAIGGNVTPDSTFNSALAIIDDVAIFNRNLAASDVDAIYNAIEPFSGGYIHMSN